MPYQDFFSPGPGLFPPAPLFARELAEERDWRLMQSFCSQRAALIRSLAERECDRLDYDGSMMFDEYPDRYLLERVRRRIAQDLAVPEADLSGENHAGGDALDDLVGVILFQEMYRRRSRQRDRRRGVIY